MSHAGQSIKKALAVVAMLDAEKPHTSITDWIEVLTSDRYEELSLDGIPELVESVNIQGHSGTGVSRILVYVYGGIWRQEGLIFGVGSIEGFEKETQVWKCPSATASVGHPPRIDR